ncbi:hypothetical protein N9Y92_03825 [Chlamydiales bacterium]|nr:hypothetical protein [Chlamydiales bacterium]
MRNTLGIPLKFIGPVKICGPILDEEIKVPLSTFETTLFPSVSRGAKVSRASGGIHTVIFDDKMTRSILVETKSVIRAYEIVEELKKQRPIMKEIVEKSSRFAKWIDYTIQVVGNLIFIRFELETGDASGHNMVTKAAEYLMNWLLESYPDLTYGSISGNICTDKKVSSVNAILGRGKYTVSEMIIDRETCTSLLRTTPEKIVELNVKKNLIGSIVSGGVRSANAHFANILLAMYLATGQDGANIVEGSQGIVHAEVRDEGLYFSVTLSNIIVGTVGHGKHHPAIQETLELLGCLEERAPGENAKRLAAIISATTLCGELSLLAAQTNPGELVASHMLYERQEKDR